MKHTDIVIGALFVVFGMIVLAIIPYHVRSSAELVDSTFVPKMTAYGMILLGAVLAISAWLAARRTPQPATESNTGNRDTVSKERYLPVVTVVAVSALYYFLMRPLGYLAATVISLALFLRIFGEKRWWMIALLSVAGAGILYVIFAGIFYVRLP